MEIIENMGTTATATKGYVGNIPNLHVKDYQRQRVYQAEEQCEFWDSPKILTSEETKALILSISKWAGVRPPKIEVGDTGGVPIAYATKDTIVLPFPTAKSIPFICHEMAHVINYNSDNADHHGVNFCATYLKIVKEFVGEIEYKALQTSFNSYHVKAYDECCF